MQIGSSETDELTELRKIKNEWKSYIINED